MQKDIIQLKDAIKNHLVNIIDSGLSLKQSLFTLDEPDGKVTNLVIEKRVRIDLGHRGNIPGAVTGS